jgi:hypothetical protein
VISRQPRDGRRQEESSCRPFSCCKEQGSRRESNGGWPAQHFFADTYRNGYYGLSKSAEEAERWDRLQSVAWSKLKNKRKRFRLDELRELR